MNSNDATEPNGPVPFLKEKRILLTAALVLLADQLTKQIVINWIDPSQQVIIIEGFFKLTNNLNDFIYQIIDIKFAFFVVRYCSFWSTFISNKIC